VLQGNLSYLSAIILQTDLCR